MCIRTPNSKREANLIMPVQYPRRLSHLYFIIRREFRIKNGFGEMKKLSARADLAFDGRCSRARRKFSLSSAKKCVYIYMLATRARAVCAGKYLLPPYKVSQPARYFDRVVYVLG